MNRLKDTRNQMNRLKCLTNELNRTKAWKKEDETIKNSKEEDEPNKNKKKAKERNRNPRKDLRHVLRVYMDMEMEEIDGKEKKTYLVGVLGDEHATWRMQDFKMSVDAATWGPRLTQDETRRGEDKSHSLNHQYGRVSLLKQSILYLVGPKPSLYRRRTDHEVYKAYTTS